MKDELDHFLLKVLPNLTKEEADFIENIIQWDGDKKAAFILAKRIFEDDE